MEKRPDNSPEPKRDSHGDHGDFFGIDVELMSPRAQVATALAVLIPVAVAGVLLMTLLSGFWWLIFVFGWTVFPAFALLVRGIAGLSEGEGRTEIPARNNRERELLEALREKGQLTPAEAAMETSLSVSEADQMLKKLAEGGHLEVTVRGGGLFYSLWEREDGEGAGRLESR